MASSDAWAKGPKALENIILATDSYKVSHYRQYPPGTEYVYSVNLHLCHAATTTIPLTSGINACVCVCACRDPTVLRIPRRQVR